MKNKLFMNGAVGVLVACAMLQTGMIVRREFFAPAPVPGRAPPRKVKDWKAYINEGSRVGPENAKVTVVEFFDFQCPFCGRFTPKLDSLRLKFPNDVAIVYRHYPLNEIHPFALTAAEASECAREQGKFKQYHDALFARQDSIGRRDWKIFATESGIGNISEFTKCLETKQMSARVDADVHAANELGVRGTPALLINDEYFAGTLPLSELDSIVRKKVNRS